MASWLHSLKQFGLIIVSDSIIEDQELPLLKSGTGGWKSIIAGITPNFKWADTSLVNVSCTFLFIWSYLCGY
jgi:hypothetical protein